MKKVTKIGIKLGNDGKLSSKVSSGKNGNITASGTKFKLKGQTT